MPFLTWSFSKSSITFVKSSKFYKEFNGLIEEFTGSLRIVIEMSYAAYPKSTWSYYIISKFASRILVIGTLRSNVADGYENVKKKQKTFGLISKTTTSHVLTFLYISFLFLHHYHVKIPNFAFCGGLKQATTRFYFSFWAWLWSLEIQLQEGSPTFDKVSG